MTMEPTCKFFAPPEAGHARGLSAGSKWRFQNLPTEDAGCANPRMGAEVAAVPCAYERHSSCQCYEPDEPKVLEAWRQRRDKPAPGEGRYVLLGVVEERLGAGVTTLTINRIEAGDPLGETKLHEDAVERFLSTRQNNLRELADKWIANYTAVGTWERAPELETAGPQRSYFAHVHTLAQRGTTTPAVPDNAEFKTLLEMAANELAPIDPANA